MKKLIQDLPKPNQDTMKVLFSHLLRYSTVLLLRFIRRVTAGRRVS